MIVLQIDFPSSGPFGADMSQAFTPLAHDIAQEAGLIWKIWTENADTKQGGGIYLFEDIENANRYLTKHTERLNSFGIENITAKIFDVNVPLSQIDKVNFLK